MPEYTPENVDEIDTESDQTLCYWCDKFGCNEKQIWAAISIVGDSAIRVEKFLRLSRQIF
jgi:hypothetical protein